MNTWQRPSPPFYRHSFRLIRKQNKISPHRRLHNKLTTEQNVHASISCSPNTSNVFRLPSIVFQRQPSFVLKPRNWFVYLAQGELAMIPLLPRRCRLFSCKRRTGFNLYLSVSRYMCAWFFICFFVLFLFLCAGIVCPLSCFFFTFFNFLGGC